LRAYLAILLTAALLTPAPTAAKGKKRRGREGAVKGENFLLADWIRELKISTRTISVGKANRGRVVRGAKMDLKGRSWRFLPAIKGRKTNHGLEGLIELLKTGADATAEKHPGAILEIGNIGLVEGGKIVQSKSHQGGRDVDVAFYAIDAKGRARTGGKFLSFGPDGKGRKGWKVDVARTWTFVKTLLSSDDPVVQWMFLSAGIKELLIKHARKAKEPRWLIDRARQVLHQPSDSSDHSDHIHIRVYCSSWDRMAGCADYGPMRSYFKRDDTAVNDLLTDLDRRARKGSRNERLAAIRQAARIPSPKSRVIVERAICDDSPKVVEAALANFTALTRDSRRELILRGLACNKSARGKLTLMKLAEGWLHPRIWQESRRLLKADTCRKVDKCKGKGCSAKEKLCARAAGALGHSSNLADAVLLAKFADSGTKRVRKAADRSLQTLLAMKDPPARKKKGKKSRAERWRKYARKVKSKSWPRYMRKRFNEAGYAVGRKLYSKAAAPALLAAVKECKPCAYSATVALASIYRVDLDRVPTPKAAYRLFKDKVKPSRKRARNGHSPKGSGKLPALPQ